MRTKLGAVVFTVMCLLYAFHLTAKADEKVYHTTPAGFPTWQVTGQRDDYLFIANFRFEQCSPNGYSLITDGTGELVYHQKVHDCRLATDFKPQSDGGLSYWLGAGGDRKSVV